MAVEHQIARLTARGPQITGEGFGGIAELSQTDVAAALAGLNDTVYWYMRLKFCGDANMLPRLRDGIAWQMLGEAMFNGLDISAKAVPSLATVAILQATEGPVCSSCNGTGTLITTETAKDCSTCRGSGRLGMTQERAASMVEVSIPTYVKRYERLVNRYVGKLEEIESEGLSHVARRLYGKGE